MSDPLAKNPMESVGLILDSIARRLETLLGKSPPALLLGLMISLLAILSASPDYRHFQPYHGTPWAADAIYWKFENPLERIPVEHFAKQAGPQDSGIIEHLEKRSFRVAVPWVSHVLQIGVTGALIAGQLIAVMFITLFYLELWKRFDCALLGALGGLAMGCSFLGQWGFSDTVYFDCVAWLLMLCSVRVKSPILIALCCAVSGLVDERAILAVPLLWLLRCQATHSINLWSSIFNNRDNWGYVAGILLFGVARWQLGLHMGEVVSTTGIRPVVFNIVTLPLAFVLLLEGWLPVILIAVVHRWVSIKPTAPILIALASCPVLAASLMVYDFSRSLAYLFPIILMVPYLLESASRQSLRRMMVLASFISFIFPCYYLLLSLRVILPVFRFL